VKGLFRRVARLLSGPGEARPELFAELEEALIGSDVGLPTAQRLTSELRRQVELKGLRRAAEVRAELEGAIARLLGEVAAPLAREGPAPLLYLMVGVNGTGKTTTIGKLAWRFRREGKRVIISAADTFRAAAIEQAEVWARRAGAEVVKHHPGGDAAAVLFDSIEAAKARGADLVIADTAGRLHTKAGLMEELRKIARVAERALGRPADEALLVVDATTGQNALAQAREFKNAVGLTGLVLAKLDGTARGGVVIAIAEQTGLPIKLIGTGEKLEDLEDFDPEAFARSVFEE
jgi:fused signal recognition particle receptor